MGGGIDIGLSVCISHNKSLCADITARLAHVDTIHRILWRPSQDKGLTQQLATCSEDRTIRLMTVHLGFH